MEYQISEAGERLDNFLAKAMDVSRSSVTKMIKNKEVLVNGKEAKAGYVTRIDDVVTVNHANEDMNVTPEKNGFRYCL